MRITVRAKPGSRQASVKKISDTEYEVAVTEQPEKGRATAAVRRAISKHLGVAQSRLSLVMGESSRTKVFEIS